jgi:hypothetical protein
MMGLWEQFSENPFQYAIPVLPMPLDHPVFKNHSFLLVSKVILLNGNYPSTYHCQVVSIMSQRVVLPEKKVVHIPHTHTHTHTHTHNSVLLIQNA